MQRAAERPRTFYGLLARRALGQGAGEAEPMASWTLGEADVDALAKVPPSAKADELQGVLYDVGRAIPRYQDPAAKGATPDKPGVSNAWFGAIYQVLLGEERGPRFGSFVELYGVENTRALIAKALKGELVK